MSSTAATASKQKTSTAASAPASVKAAKAVSSKSASSDANPKGTTAQKAARPKASQTVADKTSKTSAKRTASIQDDSEGANATTDKNTAANAANGLQNTSSDVVPPSNAGNGKLLKLLSFSG